MACKTLPQTTERVTLNKFCAQHPLRVKAATQYTQFEDLAQEDQEQGDYYSRLTVISGWEQIGDSDHKRIFVKWPLVACFIGPDRRRVKNNDFSPAEHV